MLGIFGLLCFLVDPGVVDQEVKASQRAHNIVQVILNSILVPHVQGEELGPRCTMSSMACGVLPRGHECHGIHDSARQLLGSCRSTAYFLNCQIIKGATGVAPNVTGR